MDINKDKMNQKKRVRVGSNASCLKKKRGGVCRGRAQRLPPQCVPRKSKKAQVSRDINKDKKNPMHDAYEKRT
jgi:hypothetical protein